MRVFLTFCFCFLLALFSEQLNIVRPDPVLSQKAKNLEFRNKVITELIDTETDYVRDIKLCQEGFMTVLQDKQVNTDRLLTPRKR